MSTARRLHYTHDDYLEVEKLSSVRHEYLDGEIYAMAGGTPEHSILASHVGALLASRLPKGCRVANSDLKIRILASGLSTYPDASVICGPLHRDSSDEHAVMNPSLLLEVTSKSTEDYDRGDKLSHYKQLDSLQSVLLVSHASKRLTVVARSEAGWITTDYRAGERAALVSPLLELGVDEIYSVLEGL